MNYSQFQIPILVLIVLLSFLIVMWLFARNYIKVPPNIAAVSCPAANATRRRTRWSATGS